VWQNRHFALEVCRFFAYSSPVPKTSSHHSSRRFHVGVRFPSWVGFANRVWEGLFEAATIAGGWRFEIDQTKSLGELPLVVFDKNWRGDGLITFRMTDEEGQAWHKAGMPVVNLSSEGHSPWSPRVIPDNHQAGRLAVAHLLDAGLPNLAYVGRQTSLFADGVWASGLPRRYSLERWEGFREAAEQRGMPVRFHLLAGHELWKKDAWQDVQREIAVFLRTLPLPCGVFVADDQLGLVVMMAARTLGIEIPQSLSVLGFGNDLESCLTALPALSSIVYPGKAIGLHAARTLEDMIEGKRVPEMIRVPVTSVIGRGSSAFLPSLDPVVSKLVQFIREEAPKRPLQVAELPELTPWGLSTMKKKIHAVLGHGPKKEIQRVRLARLKDLLATTDQPLSQVATTMGFGSSQDMSRFFLREAGVTPSEFRAASRSRPDDGSRTD
jgi:LacI family transcriptional regulator